MFNKSIYWIKRDIRLLDNLAFTKAIQKSKEVLPIFVFEDLLINAEETSNFHISSWLSAILDFKSEIKKSGADVLIISGEITSILSKIKKIFDFNTVFSHIETGSNLTFMRDKLVSEWFKDNGVKWIQYNQNSVARGLKDFSKENVYFNKRIINSHILPKVNGFNFPAFLNEFIEEEYRISKQKISKHKLNNLQLVTEKAALSNFSSFINSRSYNYFSGISSPNTAFNSGSRLSPHLAWGTISLKYVYQKATERINNLSDSRWIRSLEAFQDRLRWRDHFIQKLETNPDREFNPADLKFNNVIFKNNPNYIKAFFEGLTGYPLIDACLRCLNKVGFINFRMRALITSFTIHGLNIDWRLIMYPLARIFIDYEPGIHINQLQMQAGVTGTNTIRIYSPTKQTLDKDPKLKFIRTWIPELREYNNTEIFQFKNTTFRDYPKPIIDFEKDSKFTKEQVYRIKNQSKIKVSTKKSLGQLLLVNLNS